MRLIIPISTEQKQKLRDRKISDAISAGLLGKQYELDGKPLYWEDRNTDDLFPFLVQPREADTTILCNVKGQAADLLTSFAVKCQTPPEQLVMIGVATYLEGLEKSDHCDLIWKKNEQGFGQVRTSIFPKTS